MENPCFKDFRPISFRAHALHPWKLNTNIRAISGKSRLCAKIRENSCARNIFSCHTRVTHRASVKIFRFILQIGNDFLWDKRKKRREEIGEWRIKVEEKICSCANWWNRTVWHDSEIYMYMYAVVFIKIFFVSIAGLIFRVEYSKNGWRWYLLC